MLKWILLVLIRHAERSAWQPLTYCRAMAAAAPRAFLRFSRLFTLANYRDALPLRAGYVARIVTASCEDSGTCVQRAVARAAQDGVSAQILQAVVERRPEDLPGKLADVYRFTEAVVRNQPDQDSHRAHVRSVFGEQALVELGLTIAVARTFPTMQRALGYAQGGSVTEVTVPEIRATAPGMSLVGSRLPGELSRVYSAPRRFDLATIFVVSIAYSILLTALRSLGTPAGGLVFAVCLVTLVGLGQATLFGGTMPRLASICTGAVTMVTWMVLYFPALAVMTALIGPLVAGSVLGYLAGTLVGGIFLIAEYLRRNE